MGVLLKDEKSELENASCEHWSNVCQNPTTRPQREWVGTSCVTWRFYFRYDYMYFLLKMRGSKSGDQILLDQQPERIHWRVKRRCSQWCSFSLFSSFFLTVCIPSHSLWMGDCNLRNVLFISLGSLRFRLGILSLSSLSKPQMHTFLYEEKYLSTIGSQDRGRRREKRWLPRDCGRHKTHTHTAILRSLAPFCATRGLHQNTCALHSYNVASIRERRGR